MSDESRDERDSEEAAAGGSSPVDDGDPANNGDSANNDAPANKDDSANEGDSANDTPPVRDDSNTPAEDRESADDDEREWRFAVDDVGPDGVTEDTSTPESEPIEAGSIKLEHAVFVVLGVVITVGVLVLGF